MSPLPIVYLPGGAGRSWFWRRVADRLWRAGSPVVLGYPGFGDVPEDPSISSLDDFYRALLAVLPPRFVLVAQSMGNVLALRAALEHPERVAALVLCAVSGGVDVRALGAAEWRASLRSEQPESPTWFIDDASDFGERLHAIRQPALLLFGDADELAPVAVGDFLRARMPHATLCVLAGAGHWVAHEEPDRVARPMAAFLAALERSERADWGHP